MDTPIKIKCIGFSVTGYGDPSYPIAMDRYFKSLNHAIDVSYTSIGGLSIDALPYLLNKIVKKGDVDLVVLEIATSWFSFVRTGQEEADAYLQLIIQYLESIEVRIIFINLYRKDTSDHDIVVEGIKKIAQDKYPVLDFKAQYRKQFSDTGDDGTTDGVHPKPEIIQEFSQNICQYILDHYQELKIYPGILLEPRLYNLITASHDDQYELYEYKHSGLILNTVKIQQNKTIEISFDQPTRVAGIFFLYGPDTNQIKLTLDTSEINVPMRDNMSYYRRVGYRYLGIRDVTKIKIEHPLDILDIKLSRDPWEKVDKLQNYLIGFTSGI
jgi:hypothetical protein